MNVQMCEHSGFPIIEQKYILRDLENGFFIDTVPGPSKLRCLGNFRKLSIKKTTKLGNFPLCYDFFSRLS